MRIRRTDVVVVQEFSLYQTAKSEILLYDNIYCSSQH